MAVPQANLTVEPGNAIELSFNCLNQGAMDDIFTISVEGLPSGWVASNLETLMLAPNLPKEGKILIQPPRQSASRATRYPFLLRITSQSNSADMVETRCAVTVLPYLQFTSQLQPEQLQQGKQGRVLVQNLGNALETFTVCITERGDDLIFNPKTITVKVPEGVSEETSFTIQAKRKRLLGGKMVFPFTASVSVERIPGSSAQPAAVQEHEGEFVSQGAAAWWFIVLMAFCLVLALGVVIFLILNS